MGNLKASEDKGWVNDITKLLNVDFMNASKRLIKGTLFHWVLVFVFLKYYKKVNKYQ